MGRSHVSLYMNAWEMWLRVNNVLGFFFSVETRRRTWSASRLHFVQFRCSDGWQCRLLVARNTHIRKHGAHVLGPINTQRSTPYVTTINSFGSNVARTMCQCTRFNAHESRFACTFFLFVRLCTQHFEYESNEFCPFSYRYRGMHATATAAKRKLGFERNDLVFWRNRVQLLLLL